MTNSQDPPTEDNKVRSHPPEWRYLPHDLSSHSAVYYYFAAWRDDGTDQTIHDLLRWQVRENRGRHEEPSAVVLDTQTVRASVNAPKETTGLDAGKKSPGRKRDIATDVLGLLIALGGDDAGHQALAYLPEVRSQRLLRSLRDLASAITTHQKTPAAAGWLDAYRAATA